MSNKHVKWSKINAFHNVLKYVQSREHKFDTYIYRPKVKLHGTNVGIQIHRNGNLVCQGRNRILTPENDQNGFAKWVELSKVFQNAADKYLLEDSMIIYGEWCGPGIQSKVAINKIPHKIFAPFAIQFDTRLITNPELILQMCKIHGIDDYVYVIPYYEYHNIKCDWYNEKSLEKNVEYINKLVENVEQCDPFVKDTFGIEGIGEGLVWYPIVDTMNSEIIRSLLFKTKGEKHKVVKGEKTAKLKAELSPNELSFVNKFLTENRMEQGLTEVCNGYADMKKTRDFLNWIVKDIIDESEDERVISHLNEKLVIKQISTMAVKWFKAKAMSLQ